MKKEIQDYFPLRTRVNFWDIIYCKNVLKHALIRALKNKGAITDSIHVEWREDKGYIESFFVVKTKEPFTNKAGKITFIKAN